MCIIEGCNDMPIFNVTGQTELLYCYKHKFGNIIHIVNNNLYFLYEGSYSNNSYNYYGKNNKLKNILFKI